MMKFYLNMGLSGCRLTVETPAPCSCSCSCARMHTYRNWRYQEGKESRKGTQRELYRLEKFFSGAEKLGLKILKLAGPTKHFKVLKVQHSKLLSLKRYETLINQPSFCGKTRLTLYNAF